MYLIDTNVISELRNGPKANAGVLMFWAECETVPLYLAVQTVGEIQRGIENLRRRGVLPQATLVQSWLDLIEGEFAGRILNFDHESAHVWGRLMSPSHHNPIDKQIAAIALMYGLTVVTRNTEDFVGTGVSLFNPFS